MRRFFKSAAFPILLVVILAFIAQRVITNFDVLRKGGKDAAIDALKNLLR